MLRRARDGETSQFFPLAASPGPPFNSSGDEYCRPARPNLTLVMPESSRINYFRARRHDHDAGHRAGRPDPGPTYLSPSQLADLIGVNRSTISRWAATDPSMPVIRIHGVVRFRLDQVELWLAGQTQGARRAQGRARAS
jgi:hypothetical protein